MMTTERPQVTKDGRYPIGVAAKKLGVHRSTLLKYTDEKKIKCHYNRANGRKIYYGTDILTLWVSERGYIWRGL